jgi:hypothetical protein
MTNSQELINDLNTMESRLKSSLLLLQQQIGTDVGNEKLFQQAIELVFWTGGDSSIPSNKSLSQDIALIQLHFIRDLFTIYNNYREESEKIVEDLCRIIAETKIPQLVRNATTFFKIQLNFLQSPFPLVAYTASRTLPLALCCVPALILRDPAGLCSSLLSLMQVNSTHAMHVFRNTFLTAQAVRKIFIFLIERASICLNLKRKTDVCSQIG